MNEPITFSFDGEWKLYHFQAREHSLESPQDLELAGQPSVQAQVPENVDLDLFRAGQIPDPFAGANMRLLLGQRKSLSGRNTSFRSCGLYEMVKSDCCFATSFDRDQVAR